MTPSQLIAFLNAVTCGDLDAVAAKLDEGVRACVDLGEDELGGMLREARDALVAGELKAYRKRVETVVARLGHLRARQGKPSRPAVGSA